MKYGYYPGCSQKGTSRGYEESLFAICTKLGITLEELDDWNCCGTTTVIAVNKVLSLTLAARNLALAEVLGLSLVTPCPSCWLSLTKANMVIADGGPLAEKVGQALAAGGLCYKGTTTVRHVLEFLVHEVGTEAIQKHVVKSLTGVKIAPYYGCQVIRPYAQGDAADNPQNLEILIKAVGGTVASFELRTACCSGTMMATRKETGQQMSRLILGSILNAGADMVVTPCPLCQLNLEITQYRKDAELGKNKKVPVLTITQLIGMAMGLKPSRLGLYRMLLPHVTKQIYKKCGEQAKGG